MSDIDVKVEWKGYLHTEDGRICYPVPEDADARAKHAWAGLEHPVPGEWWHGGAGVYDSRRWPCLREHPVQPNPLPMVAVLPGPRRGGSIVHLMLPGYRPSGSHASTRRHPTQTMCGQHGTSTVYWNHRDKDEPTGRRHVPISVAAGLLTTEEYGWLRWCHSCVGRAAQHLDVLDQVVRLVVEADVTPKADR